MDPNDLRTLVENAIRAEIDWDLWNYSMALEAKDSKTLDRALIPAI
jgi:hypothetical protein